MTHALIFKSFAALLVIALLAPATFFSYATPAHAVGYFKTGSSDPSDLGTWAESTISAIKETAIYVETITNTAANYARYIKAYVLDPIAFIVSGNMLKSITSSILGFVGGKNSLGKPLYVQNLRGYIQNVGDVEAYSFLNQFQKQSNSPFASAITSSLRANYLQRSTAAGFFAANKSTLSKYSSDPKGFAGGNWSKGGFLAFLGLATVDQNNPYTDYFLVADQFERQRQTAMAAKLAQANWGQGILSWCGTAGGTTAGGSGTITKADGTTEDVTGTSDYKTETCTAWDDDGNCTSGTLNSDTDTDSTYSCPIGTVKAGSGGCANEDTNQYELPTDYSCPTYTTFSGDWGGCQYDDGTITVPNDANGDPATDTGGVLNDTSPTSTGTTGSLGHLNYGATGALGDPSSSGWATENLTTITSSSGAKFRVNKAAADDFSGFLKELEGTGYSINSSTSGGYNYRNIAGSTNLSEHAYGAAVDINYTLNPVTTNRQNTTNLPANIGSIAAKYNLEWGGNWTSKKDPMHFQWHGPTKTSRGPQSTLVAAAYSGLSGGSATRSGTGQVLAATCDASKGDYCGGGTSTGTSSVKPGDPCTKADGTEGKIQTPGSIIKSYLSKALGSDLDKLAGVGDIAASINGIMKDIGTITSTINAATGLFGSSGLAGFSGGSDYTSPFADYLDSSSYMGLSTSDYTIPATTTVPAPGTAIDTSGTTHALTELSPGEGIVVYPGDTISYKINIAPIEGAQTNFTITNTIPTYTTLSIQGGGTDTNSASAVGATGQIWWREDAPADGWSGYVSFSVIVDSDAPANTQICNTAQLVSDQIALVSTSQVCNTVVISSVSSQ